MKAGHSPDGQISICLLRFVPLPPPLTPIPRARCLGDTSRIPIVDGATRTRSAAYVTHPRSLVQHLRSLFPLPPPKYDRGLTPNIDRTTTSVMRGRYAMPTSMTTVQAYYSTRLVDGSLLCLTGCLTLSANPRKLPVNPPQSDRFSSGKKARVAFQCPSVDW